MPERIQLRRTKGWRLPLNAKSVARPGPWGNPFVVGRRLLVEQYPEGSKEGFGCSLLVTPEMAVALFREWSLCRQENVREIRATLAGFDLACWCKIGDPCHADVLLEIANQGAG